PLHLVSAVCPDYSHSSDAEGKPRYTFERVGDQPGLAGAKLAQDELDSFSLDDLSLDDSGHAAKPDAAGQDLDDQLLGKALDTLDK
ncbi:hypothetical protein ACM6PT_42940, partial [Klebsiella pneumoniae]